MDRFFEFLLNHWILSALFVVLIILLFIEELKSKGVGGIGISPHKLIRMMNNDEAVVLDIRPTNAFKDGHIIHAKNIPQDMIDASLKKIEKYKEKFLVLVDANGQKTVSVANKLRKAGFNKVHVLTGGFDEWKKAKMPTVKK